MNERNYNIGFTIIEILFISLLFIATAVVFFVQFNNLQSKNRDDLRKRNINAIYYSLEEVFYKDNGYYPAKITTETLPSVPKDNLKDKNGTFINEAESEYRYEPTSCQENKCKSYTLRASLEKEGDFIKKSRNK